MPWLDWPGCVNVRDVGGIATTGGGSVPARTLVRSAEHSLLTDAGFAAIRSFGVSRIVDLRGEFECAQRPSPFLTDASYQHCPVEASLGDHDTLLGLYIELLRRSAAAFSDAVAAMVSAPPGAIVVHCHAGKDRTGLVVALALAAVGVPPDAIAADYALTDADARVAAQNHKRLSEMSDRAERARWEDWLGARPETMLALLDHVDVAFGGAAAYLRDQGGLDAGQISLLRQRFTPKDHPNSHR